jgi:hypothetical protein
MKTFLQWIETVWNHSDYKIGGEIEGLGDVSVVKHLGIRIPCSRDKNNKIWYNLNLDTTCNGSLEKLTIYRNHLYWCKLVNGLGAEQITANQLDQYIIERPTSFDVTEVEGALDIAARNIKNISAN